MILSFMGEKKGRIIQAYCSGHILTVRKSELYDFSTPEKAERPVELFLQYMASDMGGDTLSL